MARLANSASAEHVVRTERLQSFIELHIFNDCMDKDNKEDFSFGRSCDLKVPVTFRMSVPGYPRVPSVY